MLTALLVEGTVQFAAIEGLQAKLQLRPRLEADLRQRRGVGEIERREQRRHAVGYRLVGQGAALG
ncbi:hypothetical protein D3C81_1408380 [compost metagenome]